MYELQRKDYVVKADIPSATAVWVTEDGLAVPPNHPDAKAFAGWNERQPVDNPFKEGTHITVATSGQTEVKCEGKIPAGAYLEVDTNTGKAVISSAKTRAAAGINAKSLKPSDRQGYVEIVVIP